VLVAGTYLVRLAQVPILEKILHALLIIFLAIPAKNFLIIAIGYLQKKIAHRTESKIDDIVFELLAKFSGVIVLVTAIIIALDLLGINVVPFIAGAGVAGVAIGFAAKDTLSNLIAGVLLIIDRPFEVGDRIEVWNAPAGTATWGDVIDRVKGWLHEVLAPSPEPVPVPVPVRRPGHRGHPGQKRRR